MKALIFISFLTISFTNTYACKCSPRTFDESIDLADLIFSGKVIKITKNDEKTLYTFLVFQTWKGEENTQIVISAGNNRCAFKFNLEEDYLVFAYNSWASICEPTSLLKLNLALDYLDIKFGKNKLTLEQKDSNQLTVNELSALNAFLDISKIEEKIDFTNPETRIALLNTRDKIIIIRPKELVHKPKSIHHLRFYFFVFKPKKLTKLTKYRQKGILVFGWLSPENLNHNHQQKIIRKLNRTF